MNLGNLQTLTDIFIIGAGSPLVQHLQGFKILSGTEKCPQSVCKLSLGGVVAPGRDSIERRTHKRPELLIEGLVGLRLEVAVVGNLSPRLIY